MPELSLREIQEILKIFAESQLQELRLDLGDTRLAVSKGGGSIGAGEREASPVPSAPAEATPAPAGAQETPPGSPGETHELPTTAGPSAAAREGLYELRSPLLGVFYRRPAPDKPPFVEVGSTVDEADPVCIIDVMKMFTQVTAGQRGRIAEICVEDGGLVQHGQTLMLIDPA